MIFQYKGPEKDHWQWQWILNGKEHKCPLFLIYLSPLLHVALYWRIKNYSMVSHVLRADANLTYGTLTKPVVSWSKAAIYGMVTPMLLWIRMTSSKPSESQYVDIFTTSERQMRQFLNENWFIDGPIPNLQFFYVFEVVYIYILLILEYPLLETKMSS